MTPSPCYHCGLPIPPNLAIRAREHAFCCHGCRAAWQWIDGAGLSEFYRRRDQTVGGKPEETDEDLSAFDAESFQNRFSRDLPQGREVSLLIEGIHCAACVWLNERALESLPGVKQARVNFASHRATILFDPQEIPLSRILATIRQIGYRARPYDPRTMEGEHRRQARASLVAMSVAGFGAGNIMMLSVALYAGYFQGIEPWLKQFLHWIAWGLATPVVFYGGLTFFRGAWRGVRAGGLNMDAPIALGILVTYGYSAAITWSGRGEVYFDSVSMFIFFLLVGRHLEGISRRKAAAQAEALLHLEPDQATLFADGQQKVIPASAIRVGDRLLVKPGERIPADGIVLSGLAQADEAMLTGEPTPIAKKPGDPVTGGAILVDGSLVMEAKKVGGETILAGIVRLMEEAQHRRGRIQTLADRAAARFVGVILLLAVAVFWWWLPQGLAVAIENTVALLIITCPCALGLATPAAVTVATGAGARAGILVRGGESFERLAQITHLALDKTGTVTTGELRVRALHPAPGVTPRQLLTLAVSAEAHASHPIARALLRAAADEGIQPLEAVDFQQIPGLGVSARLGGERRVTAGRPAFVAERLGRKTLDPPACTGAEPSWIACADGDALVGFIALGDRVRTDAKEAVATLKEQGLRLLLLSGDRSEVTAAVGREIGVEETVGGLLPGGKEEILARMAASGLRVGMVGDGVNDAPSLARAHVGIAMAGASGLSAQAAQAHLLNPRLISLPRAVDLARRTRDVIRQNIYFSLCYNAIAIPLAASGHVLPVVAAVAMPLSSLVVVGNALRLRTWKG